MIQQVIAAILTFLLCFVCSDKVMVIGEKLGLDGTLAWCVTTFLVIISVWKLASRDWGFGDAVATIVISILIMLYYTQDVGKIVLEISKVILGISVGVIIGYLAKGDD
ncbi:hypothetical protein [Methanotorris igneus]|uniref:Uncharacterized protein n=1 Tax=Methanotorris igneus (strain DSM 5666 / JCM 11834 / Kol 5) TaxID=880724 RepID=F6BBP5_METIK|nr:hypothetical protein [Methanotorris igneus]AEF96054.1 hypothetical protein Metig_0498 [Methanotorris igneus Kol 5]